MPAPIDRTGHRFGAFVVVCLERKDVKSRSYWRLRGDDGGEVVIRSDKLTAIPARNTLHGMSRTPEYRVWAGMRSRCENPNNKDFRHYGGRGISVCARWLQFENFFADMGPRPQPELTIDRYPNNDGNYEPENCRWATRAQQTENRSRRLAA